MTLLASTRAARALTHGLLCSIGLFVASCSGDDDAGPGGMLIPPGTGPTASLEGIDTQTSANGIVDLPSTVDARITDVFARYTRLNAPNGERIHFLAQSGISDALIFRTRGMLAEILANVEATTYGVDKTDVRNEIANSMATIAIMRDDMSLDPTSMEAIDLDDLFGDLLEPVMANRMVQEGSPEYLLPSPAIDPTFGELAGFVLRRGIIAAAPALDQDLTDATDEAITANLFLPPAGFNSLERRASFLSLALDVYYGIWGHDPANTGIAGDTSRYNFVTRQQMEMGNPEMISVIESFFATSHSYPAFLDEDFAQTFEMRFDSVLPYTHRARYLERIGLRGTTDARVNGNELDNVFVGNEALNRFQGRGGNDIVDLKGGADIVVMRGLMSEYTVTDQGNGVIRIEDNVLNRDGIDDVRGAAQIVYSDVTIDL